MSNATLSLIRPATCGAVCCSLILAGMAGCHPSGSNRPAAGPTAADRAVVAQEEATEGGSRATSRAQSHMRVEQAARVEDLLVGRFPGVEVYRTADGGIHVRIRGGSTLSGSGEPLFVVDGVEVFVGSGRGLDWINPADVASINVLKDATSTTMYGVRGANGVILITTKRAP